MSDVVKILISLILVNYIGLATFVDEYTTFPKTKKSTRIILLIPGMFLLYFIFVLGIKYLIKGIKYVYENVIENYFK